MVDHPCTMGPTEVEHPRRHLDSHQREQLEEFLNQFDACRDEQERYILCLHKRDQLLGNKGLLEIEFSIYGEVFAKSPTYNATKDLDKEWREFVDTADDGSRLLKEIQSAAKYWGNQLIQYLSVERRGIHFARKLARTARQHQKWENEAIPRLQQLVLRRIQMSKSNCRHTYKFSIEPTDLDNAMEWKTEDSFVKRKDPAKVRLPFRKVREEEVPAGYILDVFGLIVPKDAAVDESSDTTASSRPSPEATKTTKSGDTDTLSYTHTSTTGHTNTDCSSIGSDTSKETRRGSGSDTNSDTRQDTTGATSATASDGETSGGEAGGQDARHGGGTSTPGTDSATDPVMLRKSLPDPAGNHRPLAPEIGLSSSSRGTRRYSRRRQNGRATFALAKHEFDTERLEALTQKLTTMPESYMIPMKRPRASSKPDVPQLDVLGGHLTEGGVQGGYDPGARPVCNWQSDEAYRIRTINEISQEARKESNSRGSRAAKFLLPILQGCKHPITDDKLTDKDARPDLYLLNGYQAKALLDETTPDIPIITAGQQPFQWVNPANPISEFFDWIVDLERTVSVQIPSLRSDESSCELRSLREVQKRLLSRKKSDDPWNILDCGCPLPQTLPYFLTGWNCQLLSRIRETVLDSKNSAERPVVSRKEWAEWREIEHWTLLSEGGHCTAAHMDSHGLATWITVQGGLFGFAWMSRPTPEQRQAWIEDTEHYDQGQQWRYWILKPGQTVFFPSGTIHSVFRTQQAQTLGLGGHILQWSGLKQWLNVIRQQVEAPDSTNEDMTDVGKWFPMVEGLVENRLARYLPA